MKSRRILSALLLSLGLILLTFAATCRLVMTNIQINYDPSSPATSSPNSPAWNSTVPALMTANPSSSWNKPTAPMIVTTVSPSTLPQPSAPTKSPRISPPRAMSSLGPSSTPLPKTKRMPAIGPPPTASLPTANMIWNAAIITDVQHLVLARNNHSLYNPIISQTAKQNYSSVSTKLFK